MKKNLFSTLLLILMVAALMVTAVGCGAKDDGSADRIAEPEGDGRPCAEVPGGQSRRDCHRGGPGYR